MINIFNTPASKIVKQTEFLLREQINSTRDSEEWHKNMANEYVLGYIFMFSLVLIKSKLKDEKKSALGVSKVFDKLFRIRKKNGNVIRIMWLTKKYANSKIFQEGSEKARLELVEWINNNGTRPNGLAKFLNKKSK